MDTTTNTIFRSKIEPSKSESKPVAASEQAKPVVNVEPPYLDYTQVNSRPFTADYFNLGQTWDDPHGGFPVEISTIEGYLQKKIQSGDLPNSQSAVKEELKKLEKMTNVSKEERSIIKVETLAAYVRFLQKTDDIKYQMRRYANTQ